MSADQISREAQFVQWPPDELQQHRQSVLAVLSRPTGSRGVSDAACSSLQLMLKPRIALSVARRVLRSDRD